MARKKKGIEFSTTQLILLVLVAILILFFLAFYTGLKDNMMNMLDNLFG